MDAWRILINLIWSWSPWSRRILNLLIFRNKHSLNRIWILFVLLQKRKLISAWKGNCSTLICFFCFKPSSSPTQLDFFLEPLSPFENKQNPNSLIVVIRGSFFPPLSWDFILPSWYFLPLHRGVPSPHFESYDAGLS